MLQAILSFVLWLRIALWIDTGWIGLGKVMGAYLLARTCLILLEATEIGWRVQALFWLCFMTWAFAVGVQRLVRNLTAA